MKKTMKIIGLTIVTFIALIVLLGGIYIWMLSEAFSKTYGDSEEELNQYANAEMGREIDVLERTERKWGKHRTKEVTVKTADREGIVFTIKINRSGETSGDDFEEQEAKSDFKAKYANNPEIHKLTTMGFIQPKIGIKSSEQDLSMGLPSKVKLSDEASFEVIMQALPLIRTLDEKVTADTGYPLEELYIDGERLDLTKGYETAAAIGNQLAAENITIFYPNFYSEDKGEIQEVLYEVQGALFEIDWKNPGLTCLALEDYEVCKSYRLTFTVDTGNEVGTFDMESDGDLRQLLEIIQLVNKTNVPIDVVQVKPVFLPGSGDKELIEKTVKVQDVQDINEIEEIQFDYD